MIDVTFLLLIYFMVTTVLAPDERLIDSAIRQERDGARSDARDFQPQRLLVTRDGDVPVWRIGQRVLGDREELDDLLASLPTDAGIVIVVDEGVSVAFAVAAMQSARDAGFEEVAYVPATR
ncbi:MAG: ExbD/TolR family protein [Phycisphaerales bacterium]